MFIEAASISDRDIASARAWSPAVIALLALVAALCAVWFVAALGYWEDDAYIHLEFARSLAQGRGFSFNGHVVYGDTAPLWVGLLVAVHALVPAWLVAGKALTAVAAVFALGGCFHFSRAMVAGPLSPPQANLFAATMLLVVVTGPYFGYWAFSGMEALAAAGLACYGALLVSAENAGPARFLAAALVAGVAPLLRPEMGFLTVLLGLVLLRLWIRMRRRIAAKVGLLLAGALLTLGPGLAWAIYARRTFGSILPNTNAAKRAAIDDSVLVRLLHVYGFGYPTLLLGLLVLAGGFVLYRSQLRGSAARCRPLPLGGWVVLVWVAVTTAFYVANHTFVQTRYIFVSAPAALIVLSALALRLHPSLFRTGLIVTLAYGVVVSALSTRPLVRNKVAIDRRYADLAAVVRGLPPGATVAEYSIGEAAFLSERPVLDTGGITRPDAIPYLFTANDSGLQAWIRRQGAHYEVVDHQPAPGATLLWSVELPATGWTLDPRRYRGRERLQLWKLP